MMNLGDISIKSIAAICVGSCLLALLIVLVVWHVKRIRWTTFFVALIPLALVLCVAGCYFGHGPLFAAWHRAQNTVLPSNGCLTYEPSFFRLYATYRMSRAEFDEWAKGHPWRLASSNEGRVPACDAEALRFGHPEAAYASEAAPNGGQLRVYYANGTMYVAYFAM
jgi:hypothetical protein